MSDRPKKQREYFQKIRKALESGDEEMYQDLVRQKNPLAIRHDLSEITGELVKEGYENPLNAFQNQKLLETVPVEYTNLPKTSAGRYNLSEGKILLPKVQGDMTDKQLGTLVHEFGHEDDRLKGFTASEAFDPSLLKKTGAEAAEAAFGKHHARGFFEKEAIIDLLKNKKLATALPILKAAGIGALGASAIGIGNKAMAGEIGQAGLDTADLATDFIPGVGEAKIALTPSELGSGELPPEEMLKRERFNQLQKRLLNK